MHNKELENGDYENNEGAEVTGENDRFFFLKCNRRVSVLKKNEVVICPSAPYAMY